MALFPSASPWPKYPLRMKFMRETGRVVGGGLKGRPITMALHFPLLDIIHIHFFLFI
jgi:hypothetical protein